MHLYEKYRPRRLSQLVGQDKAVATVRRLVAGGLGGQALWITGKTGVGKTTLAGILARSFASDYQVFEFASGRSLTKADLDEAERQTHLYGCGGANAV
jgi:DNA polymerase-3 subunit gamma/tau